MILLPLKLKYRVYRSYQGGKYVGRTGNTHGPKKHSVQWYLIRALKQRGK